LLPAVTSFTPDGKRFALRLLTSESGDDLWTVPLEGQDAGLRAGKPEVFLQTPFYEAQGAFSPDGRWLAYTSNANGSLQVYVRSFPDTGGMWQVSDSGGLNPAWSRKGHELFFRTVDGHVMVAAYAVKGDSFVPEKPRLWYEKRIATQGLLKDFDVSPDGSRIAAFMPVVGPEGDRADHQVVLLQNFFDELRRRAPVGR
jgi:serine/threonine-protein kinase